MKSLAASGWSQKACGMACSPICCISSSACTRYCTAPRLHRDGSVIRTIAGLDMSLVLHFSTGSRPAYRVMAMAVPGSDEAGLSEAELPVATDDDVIVQNAADRAQGRDELLGHGDVGFRRARIAARVVVDEDDRRRAGLDHAPDHLARVERGVIDRAAMQGLVLDQGVLAVEEQDPGRLDRLMAHGDRQIVHQRRGRADHRPVLEWLAERRPHGDADDLEQEHRWLIALQPCGKAVRLRNPPAADSIAQGSTVAAAG